jgi:hypothetical protein
MFFKSRPDNTTEYNEDLYPELVSAFSHITDEQILQAIKWLSPYKAPGPNGVCNVVFIKTADLLVPHLGHIFKATFDLGFYPETWKISTTIVLRKPGQPDYTIPKAYCPITLLDTMAKILSSCIAEDITYIAEKHQLLPWTHFGGRPGRSTVDSIHLLTKFIHNAWAHSTDKYMSLLFLDVKAAFPSVVIERLIHNMRSRGIPKEYTEWYKHRLDGRITTLFFNDFILLAFQIPIGLDQGCPISSIMFLFYNTDLIGLANREKDKLGLGFMDDTAYVARGKDFRDANEKLREIMECKGGALEWSREHHVEFELNKTALLGVSRVRIPDPQTKGKTIPTPCPPITIQGHTIIPSKSDKFLGVFINNELRFMQHAAYAIAKGTKYVLASKRMTKESRGIKARMMKKLYEGVAIPKMLYTADVWETKMIEKGKGKRMTAGEREDSEEKWNRSSDSQQST